MSILSQFGPQLSLRLELVPPRALARHSDPDTSKASAKSMKPKHLSDLQTIIINDLKRFGPGNCDELVSRTAIPWNTLTPRMAPLERAGFIRRAGTKRGVSGKAQILWEAV